MSEFLDNLLKNFDDYPPVKISRNKEAEEPVHFSITEKREMIKTFCKKTNSIKEITELCRKEGFWDCEEVIRDFKRRGDLAQTGPDTIRMVF